MDEEQKQILAQCDFLVAWPHKGEIPQSEQVKLTKLLKISSKRSGNRTAPLMKRLRRHFKVPYRKITTGEMNRNNEIVKCTVYSQGQKFIATENERTQEEHWWKRASNPEIFQKEGLCTMGAEGNPYIEIIENLLEVTSSLLICRKLEQEDLDYEMKLREHQKLNTENQKWEHVKVPKGITLECYHCGVELTLHEVKWDDTSTACCSKCITDRVPWDYKPGV